MTVTDLNERWLANPINQGPDGTTVTRQFIAKTDIGGYIGAFEIMDEIGIRVGDSLSFARPLIRVVRIIPTLKSSEKDFSWYNIDIEYDSDQDSTLRTVGRNDDDDYDAVWSFDIIEEVVRQDINDKNIVNSAGGPILITRDKSILTLNLTRVEDEFDTRRALLFKDTVNQGSITIAGHQAADETARLRDITATLVYTDRAVLFNVTYKFQFLDRIWRQQVLDEGLFYRNDNGDLIDKDPKTQSKITSPIKLDGTGKPLITTLDNPGNASYINFKIIPRADWRDFKFPRKVPNSRRFTYIIPINPDQQNPPPGT